MSKGLHGSFPLALLPVTHFSFLGWFYSPLLRSSWQVSKSSGIFKILGVSTTLTGFSLLYAMNSHSLFTGAMTHSTDRARRNTFRLELESPQQEDAMTEKSC